MSKFNKVFSEPVLFYPEGLYISAEVYSKQQAIKVFEEYYLDYFGEDININEKDIGERWVRFGFMPHSIGLYIDNGWVTCDGSKDKHGAKKAWEYI